MKCAEFENQLNEWLDARPQTGSLPSELALHAAQCRQCQETWKSYQILLLGVREGFPANCPADMSARVLEEFGRTQPIRANASSATVPAAVLLQNEGMPKAWRKPAIWAATAAGLLAIPAIYFGVQFSGSPAFSRLGLQQVAQSVVPPAGSAVVAASMLSVDSEDTSDSTISRDISEVSGDTGWADDLTHGMGSLQQSTEDALVGLVDALLVEVEGSRF